MPSSSQQPLLLIYCAASVEPAISVIVAAYNRETGTPFKLETGPSGVLIDKFKRAKQGDLYIPASQDPYLNRCQADGSVTEIIPLAALQLVLATNPQSALAIVTLQDLLACRIRYAIAHEEAAAGLATLEALAPLGDWQKFAEAAQVILPSVTEVAQAIRDGNDVDCGIVWDATARQYGLTIIDLAELSTARATIAAGILAASSNTAAARKFVDYLAAPNKGLAVFKTLGYETAGN